MLDFDDTTNEDTIFTGIMPQHYAGWTEFNTYSEAVRQTLTLGTVSGVVVATDNTKSGSSDTLNVTITFTAAAP